MAGLIIVVGTLGAIFVLALIFAPNRRAGQTPAAAPARVSPEEFLQKTVDALHAAQSEHKALHAELESILSDDKTPASQSLTEVATRLGHAKSSLLSGVPSTADQHIASARNILRQAKERVAILKLYAEGGKPKVPAIPVATEQV